MAKIRRRLLRDEVARLYPDFEDVDAVIEAGKVRVGGVPVVNPRTLVAVGTSIAVEEPKTLRGVLKLGRALEAFGIACEGRVALDAGSAAGGFVQALLERGVRKIYAVEVGFGQLLGSLCQDPRVVSLERTNIGDLDMTLVPDRVDIITLDLGYLALATGVPQITNALDLADGGDLVALVKPMSELRLGYPPLDAPLLDEAQARAAAGIEGAGWQVVGSTPSPIRGSKGAIEFFLHARWIR